MAKPPVILAGIGMAIVHPDKVKFANDMEVSVNLKSAVDAFKQGFSKFEYLNVVIERLPSNQSPLDLGAEAVRISPRGGEGVVVSYSQLANLFS